MTYDQITQEERYQLAALRAAGLVPAAIARQLGRHRSTIVRELHRNRTARGRYVAYGADGLARARRQHSRRNQRVQPRDWGRIHRLLAQRWSPEQIAGRLARDGVLRVSRATIYRGLDRDQRAGGTLWRRLRRSHRRQPTRGRPPRASRLGRPLTERPVAVEARQEIGHWEIDTVLGRGSQACIVTMVERATNFVAIGALAARTATAFANRTIALIATQARRVRTITADNGTEVTGHPRIERRTGARFYFAAPYRSWERAINENMNGLVREYLPKGRSLAGLTQHDCNRIARQLNRRPRKRLAYRTPEECYVPHP
jgi:IS30 family transposase